MQAAPSYGVILAGGGARRMGGGDKGEILLAGKRLFDHVYEKLKPQVERVVVSGVTDYGAGLVVIPDQAQGPDGPAAGLFATYQWLKAHMPANTGFITAPIDAPFLPPDLATRLCSNSRCAIAQCEGRIHPTFAYWEREALSNYFRDHDDAAPALRDIAAATGARRVTFEKAAAFFNVNSPDDLQRAETLLASSL